MKSLEITLKVCFLILAVALIATRNIVDVGLWSFLVVSFGLGIVLIINKKNPSYQYPKKYKYMSRIYSMRRIEGMLLVIFAFAGLVMLNVR